MKASRSEADRSKFRHQKMVEWGYKLGWGESKSLFPSQGKMKEGEGPFRSWGRLRGTEGRQ